MQPLNDWMIVELTNEEKKSSALLVPDAYKDDHDLKVVNEAAAFKIVAIGPGHYELGNFIKPSVEVGDVVVLEGKLAVSPIKYQGKTVLLAQARYVALILEKSKEKGGGDNGRNRIINSKT